MIWGIFVATYSSVFICSPMLIYLGLRNSSAEAPPEPPGKAVKPKPAPPARPVAVVKTKARA
jgi:preprotein translocase subunit SecF